MMEQPAVMHKALAVALLLAAASVLYWKAASPQASVDVPSFRVHSSTFASVMPTQLQGAPFNVSLGCWHIQQIRYQRPSFHVVADANFEPGERWEEVQGAILRTHESNPDVHYVLVTQKLSMLELASSTLADVSLDLWFCPEVLYGTPIHIGNLYPGPKFAISIDNWLPEVTWKCTFSTGKNNQPVVYVVQRTDRAEFSSKGNRTCQTNIQGHSADGILYDQIPTDVVNWLRFPRTYWGCESVALFVLKRAGIKLVNLCPFYSPFHTHKERKQDSERLRVNHQVNSLPAGELLDMQPFCQHINGTLQ